MRLAILDASAIFYAIAHTAVDFADDAELMQDYAECSIKWVNALQFCPQLAAERQQNRVLWVCDSPPYWREDFLPEYKSHRGSKPPNYNAVLKAFNKLRDSGQIIAMSLPRQEADDLAAAILRTPDLPFKQYFLLTVDSDWQGLLRDSRVLWCDIRGYEPRVRTSREVYAWLASKHKKQPAYAKASWHLPPYYQFTPEQIWAWKSAVGDASDRVGPGEPPYLINLFNPPQAYDALRHTGAIKATTQRLVRPGVDNTLSEGGTLYEDLNSFGVGPPLVDLRVEPYLIAPLT